MFFRRAFNRDQRERRSGGGGRVAVPQRPILPSARLVMSVLLAARGRI